MRYSQILSLAATLMALLSTPQLASAQEVNPLFTEEKIQNYLPHMTWPEVEDLLTRTDVALMPVGSIEQHGRHLPLGTDSYAAIEVCKLIAQQTDVLVAPSILAGISPHHMGFTGSLTISPETFETVLFEVAENLIHHGIRKIAFYNGHGGNSTSVASVINRINNSTVAAAVDLSGVELPPLERPVPSLPMDFHAGVGETSWMLYLTPSLVQMEQAENPVLTPPQEAQRVIETMTGGNQALLGMAYLFRPEATGKRAASHEISSNGVFTTGDLNTATAEEGRLTMGQMVAGAVRFIEEWKRIR